MNAQASASASFETAAIDSTPATSATGDPVPVELRPYRRWGFAILLVAFGGGKRKK